MIIKDNLGEFNTDLNVIKTLVVYNKTTIGNIYRTLTYKYEDKYFKMIMSSEKSWEWSGGFVEDFIYHSLFYIIVKSIDRKVIFLGDLMGGCNAILDYETGIELEWDITDKNVSDFVTFIMCGLYYQSGKSRSISPEKYKDIVSVPCKILPCDALDVLDDPNYEFKHMFLIP